MKASLKNLSEQTIILTVASSGIGLVAARMAAKRKTKLVLTANTTC